MLRRNCMVLATTLVFWGAALGACDCGSILRVGPAVADATSDGANIDVDATAFDAEGLDHPFDAAPQDVAPRDSSTDLGTTGPADGSSLDTNALDSAQADAAPTLDASAAVDAGNGCNKSCAAGGTCVICVEIFIDNFCHVSVNPETIDVPADTTAHLVFHNRSVDYAADIWFAMGYGFLDLPTAASWDHAVNDYCEGPTSYTATADIGPAGVADNVCSHRTLRIVCH